MEISPHQPQNVAVNYPMKQPPNPTLFLSKHYLKTHEISPSSPAKPQPISALTVDKQLHVIFLPNEHHPTTNGRQSLNPIEVGQNGYSLTSEDLWRRVNDPSKYMVPSLFYVTLILDPRLRLSVWYLWYLRLLW